MQKDSVLKGGNFNNYKSQCPPYKYEHDWHQKDAYSIPSSRSLYIPSFSLSQSLYEKPLATGEYEQCLHQDRQNNSCYCGTCDSYLGRKRADRESSGGSRSSSLCDRHHRTSDPALDYDLYGICDRLKRLIKLRKNQSQLSSSQSLTRINEKTKSPAVLSRPMEPPHTRNLTKTVPYQLLESYSKLWRNQLAIGEDFRYRLRQNVRHKLLRIDGIKLAHKMFVPNPYVVPTEKKRYGLRWIVRECNNKYMLPPHGAYHDV